MPYEFNMGQEEYFNRLAMKNTPKAWKYNFNHDPIAFSEKRHSKTHINHALEDREGDVSGVRHQTLIFSIEGMIFKLFDFE